MILNRVCSTRCVASPLTEGEHISAHFLDAVIECQCSSLALFVNLFADAFGRP